MGALPLRKTCPNCQGRGIVPRARNRIMIDGLSQPDPRDTRPEELCPRCCGSGQVPDAGPTSETPS